MPANRDFAACQSTGIVVLRRGVCVIQRGLPCSVRNFNGTFVYRAVQRLCAKRAEAHFWAEAPEIIRNFSSIVDK